MLRVLTLALLSSGIAEFLLGDQWLGGIGSPGQQVAQLVLFTAFYGSAAVLIREITRRGGRGWPAMLLLALAFGVIEEGLIDQSLFNPDFAGRRLLDPGFIPAVGIGGPWTIFVLSLHVIWSIGAPIAIAEALYPDPLPDRPPRLPQRQAPWLRVGDVIVAVVLCIVGAAAIFFFTTVAAGFAAQAGQLVGAAAIAGVAVPVALRMPRRSPRGTRPLWPAVLLAFATTSGYMLVDHLGALSPWLVCGLLVALLLLGGIIAALYRLDVLGLAAGAVLTYCWVGLVSAASVGWIAVLEQSVIVLLVLAVVGVAVRRRVGVRSARLATP
ncbi:hypothetical protein [Rathayibacter sp. YIM 133350]|uniref:hypothetical protein n=1 Tax=Rathayibacter sp. YIM 133350 TaxID=3131992 RepID=UPI00307EB65B